MKNFRKIIAAVLALTLLLGVFVFPVSAADTESEEEYVARMYIGHKPRYYNLSGHTWIYIENLTNHNLTVGAYTLAKNKGVSVGTFGYSVADGRGLYYNVEAYRYRNVDPSSYIYISKELTQEQLDRVSNAILYSGVWSYILNCAFFATGVWNMTLEKPVAYLLLPTLHQVQILLYPSHSEGFKMTNPKSDEIFKQIGIGKNARLEIADPKVPE